MTYQAPTRQALQRLRVGPFKPATEVGLQVIDAKLELLFGPDWDHLDPVATATDTPDNTPDDRDATAIALSRRILAVAAYLQRSAKIPVMMSGILRRVGVEPGPAGPQLTLDADVPIIRGVPRRITEQACQFAVRTLRWCGEASPAMGTAEFQSELGRGFVTPASSVLSETGGSGIYVAMGAYLADIPFAHLGRGRYLLGWGTRAILTHRSSIATDSALGCRLATDKSMTAELLRMAGLPVPDQRKAVTEDQALEAAAALGWPVVVKPRDRERGEGVTVGLCSQEAVRAAFGRARQASPNILVERHVEGVCHRILVVRGRVLLAVKRNPQQVEGDGVSCISDLIGAKNSENLAKPPWTRAQALPEASEIADWLADRGLTPQSVPARGQTVDLRPFESLLWGGLPEVVTERIHPENAEVACRAAALLGISVAGVDLITPDISVPWHDNGGAINEVNHAPFFAVKPQRSYLLREFVEAILPNGGRIPVDLVIGDDNAVDRGRELQRQRCATGERCYLVSAGWTRRPDGSDLPSTASGLYQRTRALLLDPTVDAIVMVAHDDTLMSTGLPVDRISTLDATTGDGLPWAQKLSEWGSRFIEAEQT